MSNVTQKVNVFRRRQIALSLTALVGAAGVIWSIPNTVLLVTLIGAGGLIWSSRERKAWLLAALLVVLGLLWSVVDPSGCTVGWIVYAKLSGRLPYIEWGHIGREVLAPCSWARLPSIHHLDDKSVDGRKWERYHTDLGEFWLVAPGKYVLTRLVWEMTVQQVYESPPVAIRPGDTVIDCGAHVGVFCKYSLRRGAGRVIAIEPDSANLACLEDNLAPEIAAGRVVVFRGGVWDQKASLPLWHSEENSAVHSFVFKRGPKIEAVPLLPLDEILGNLKLDRVDFIKMDIEGAERRALEGARQTLARFKPRMAICTYHLPDDPVVIPATVKRFQPAYQIHAKDVAVLEKPRRIITKVLFFQ